MFKIRLRPTQPEIPDIYFDPPNLGCWIWVSKAIWKQIWLGEMEVLWTTVTRCLSFNLNHWIWESPYLFIFIYIYEQIFFNVKKLHFYFKIIIKWELFQNSSCYGLRYLHFTFTRKSSISQQILNIEYSGQPESTRRIQQKDKYCREHFH